MNFIEFIGFIVTLIAMGYLMVKQNREAKETVDEDETEEDAQVKQILRSLNIKVRQEVPIIRNLPPVPPKPVVTFKQPVRIPVVHEPVKEQEITLDVQYPDGGITSFDAVPSEVSTDHNSSRIKEILKTLPSNRELLIIHDVFGLPVGLKDERTK